jgi:tetratricopeptide (TPR) repeat protein
MKFSNTYIIYPDNKVLELALAKAIGMLGEDLAADATPDTRIAVADNFLYTRGNFEQHRFSSKILDSAREAVEASLTDAYHAEEPLAWAETQNILGNILAAKAQQLRDDELFEKAIQCFNHALAEFDQEKSPMEWAATQNNLATAQQALGRQLDSAKLLKEAADAYTNALLVWSRKETPEPWAAAMHQLGATFHTYGKLLKGNRTFQKSVVSYKNALAEFDADNNAFELAATHNNCGAVLHNLGESEQNADRLHEAIRSYETALTVCMEQQLPIHLAVLCRVNRATAQNVLAELSKDAALAEEAADEFEVIIECFPHALQPLCLKHCQAQIIAAKLVSNAASA